MKWRCAARVTCLSHPHPSLFPRQERGALSRSTSTSNFATTSAHSAPCELYGSISQAHTYHSNSPLLDRGIAPRMSAPGQSTAQTDASDHPDSAQLCRNPCDNYPPPSVPSHCSLHAPLHCERSGPEWSPIEVYQSIGAQPRYRQTSHEEIRAEDYKAGRFGVDYNSAIGYVRAHIAASAIFRPPESLRMSCISRPELKSVRATTIFAKPILTVLRLGHKFVTFKVGSEPLSEKFSIHEATVIHNSELFRLALQKEWTEAKNRVIPLPDDSPAVFSLYQQ